MSCCLIQQSDGRPKTFLASFGDGDEAAVLGGSEGVSGGRVTFSSIQNKDKSHVVQRSLNRMRSTRNIPAGSSEKIAKEKSGMYLKLTSHGLAKAWEPRLYEIHDGVLHHQVQYAH